jgi:preprotein translocase subunit YajC
MSIFPVAFAEKAVAVTTAATNTVATTTTAAKPSGISPFLILAIFGFIIYFLMWRPQSKRAKQVREMLAAIKVGDEVLTIGGIYGKVVHMDDASMTLEIAANTKIMVQKSAVASVLPKGTLKF